MYLRVTQRRDKGGEVVRYVQLAHNERNEHGVPVARISTRSGVRMRSIVSRWCGW
ncbi:MAG: hypothetical protein M3Y17_09760 [Actinomycetota bacterium]|nr:hypothetical protein [Actinomycetota bacterium]